VVQNQLSEQFGGDLTFEDGGGERVEFQLHGIGGPESYKFGFDTGNGYFSNFLLTISAILLYWCLCRGPFFSAIDAKRFPH